MSVNSVLLRDKRSIKTGEMPVWCPGLTEPLVGTPSRESRRELSVASVERKDIFNLIKIYNILPMSAGSSPGCYPL
jgi:hypothetical protein